VAESFEFPEKTNRTKEELDKSYLRVFHALSPSSLCHFSLSLTSSWKAIDISAETPTPERRLATIGLLRRVSQPEAEIEIIAAAIPREIDPADWLELHLTQNRHQIIKSRRWSSRSGQVGDCLSTIDHEGSVYVTRSSAVKDDGRVFMVHCRVRWDGYTVVAEEFLMAILTFELTSPTGENYAEILTPYQTTAPIHCSIQFPASWVFKEDRVPPPGGTSFSLLNLRGQEWHGQFTFAAIPRELEDNYRGLLLNYFGELKRNGIRILEDQVGEEKCPEPFERMWAGILAGQRNAPMEIRCIILQHKRAWLLLALVGPAREAYPDAQMINSRAFRVALETLHAA
jgi:hypothetical protein